MGLKLLESEKQIMEGKANKSGWFGSRGGKLILTNQRLLFVDHGFNIRQGGDVTTLATKKVTIYTEILLSCEYCAEQNLFPRAHLRNIQPAW